MAGKRPLRQHITAWRGLGDGDWSPLSSVATGSSVNVSQIKQLEPPIVGNYIDLQRHFAGKPKIYAFFLLSVL